MRQVHNEKKRLLHGSLIWRCLLLAAGVTMAVQVGLARSAHATGFLTLQNTVRMTSARSYHTSTTLLDGRVLIAGGTSDGSTSLSSAEIYDPTTGKFTATASPMGTPRRSHTATLLADGTGRVLIAGGINGTSTALNSAELFDPATGNFSSAGTMPSARFNHTATRLNDGTVLIAGGQTGSSRSTVQKTAFIYNPAGTFTATANDMTVGRKFHTATLLADGRVLLAGGTTPGTPSMTNTADIYTPGTKTFAATATTMTSVRDTHTAVLLNSGKVLITGGSDASGTYLASAETFDPAGGGTFAATGSMGSGRYAHTASLLPNGKVLVAGGFSPAFVILATGEIFDPAGGSFTSAGTMRFQRTSHAATALSDGTVLITGGTSNGFGEVDIYNPASIIGPASFVFPGTFIHTLSDPQSFTFTNTGAAGLAINNVAITGVDSSMFTLGVGSCGALPHSLAANGGNCDVTVTFTPSTSGNKAALLTVTSNDPEKPTLTIPLSGTAISFKSTIAVSFAGDGAGSTSSTIQGLNCLSSTPPSECVAEVDNGTEVTIIPTGDKDSLFNSWASTPLSPGCSGSGSCVTTVNGFTAVTATFDFVQPARVGAIPFSSLYDAYMGAYLGGFGNVIQARAWVFPESLVLDSDIGITIKGGYNLTYSANSDYSVLHGSLRVSKGSVIIEKLVIQ